MQSRLVVTQVMTTDERATQGAAGRREWLGLAVLALPTLLLSLDISVLYLALPHIGRELGASAVQQLWIMDSYTFLLAGFLVTMGALGDRTGRRRLLLVGAAAFGAASVAAAWSASPEMLIATRALMGVAGAALMPSTLALISTMFTEPRQRGTAIGVWASCMMAGAALGPVVGGVLLDAFWWGAAFLMAVPVTAVLLVAGPVLLPEARNPGAGRVDVPSVALSLAAVLPFVYGLKEIAASGVRPPALVALAAGAVVAVAFVRRQRRLPDPLLDPALFRVRAVSTALTVIVVGGVFLSGIFLLVSQHLQLVAGLSPTAAGLWLAPVGVAVAVGATVAPALARSVRPAHLLAGGLTLSAAGSLALTQVGTGGGFALLVTGMVVVYLGVGPTMALGTELVVGSVPPAKAGAASATSESATELGAALGIALVGSLAAAVYRSTVQLPAGTAAAAGESLTAAGAVAHGQPPQHAAAVLAAAREAFTAGLTTAAAVACAGFAALAVLTVIRLRGPAA